MRNLVSRCVTNRMRGTGKRGAESIRLTARLLALFAKANRFQRPGRAKRGRRLDFTLYSIDELGPSARSVQESRAWGLAGGRPHGRHTQLRGRLAGIP